MDKTHYEVVPEARSSARALAAINRRISSGIGYENLPRDLARYLILVSLGGPFTATAWIWFGPDSIRPDRWLLFGILTTLACLAERFPVHLTHKTYINVATAVYVAMLLAMPLPLCGLAALVAVTVAQVLRWLSNHEFGLAEPLFNIGQTALYVTSAAIAVSAIDRLIGQPPGVGDIPLVTVITASAVLHLMNCGLVAGASARHLGTPTIRVWQHTLLIDIGPHAGMTLVGLCAAQLGYASPLLVPALAVPAVLVHRAVQHSVTLRENVREALASLVEIVELRDPYTAGHSRRVAQLARQIALEMGMSDEEADAIEDAGQVHDLGKVAVDPAILLKPGKLTDAEWAEMKLHPVFGAEVLSRFESYRDGVPLVRGHHESWDGSGYPDQTVGHSIPLGARILAVADTFDALTSDRPYRSGMDRNRAADILREGAGKQWDPTVVGAFLSLMGKEATERSVVNVETSRTGPDNASQVEPHASAA